MMMMMFGTVSVSDYVTVLYLVRTLRTLRNVRTVAASYTVLHLH
jgi:uncharacterized protein YebE (UPF0316 family)